VIDGTAPLRFDGRVAIVTGAGHGLGREYALLLASRGAQVVVNDLGGGVDGTGGDAAPAEAVAAEIRGAGGAAVANDADVASDEGASSIVEAALREFGRVDIVVNNAGILRAAPFAETTSASLRLHLEVHVVGSFNVTRAAWEHMAAQQYGRVVLTTSNVMLGAPGFAAYSAAKGAVLGLMRTLAVEGTLHGIKVNAIAPSALTRMVDHSRRASTVALDALEEERRTPRAVSPAVAVLAHECCPVSGDVLVSAGGVVARMIVSETPGYRQLGHTPEDIVASWWAVTSEAGAYVPADTADSMTRRRAQILET
jgi:NAD(P)-dependent dehydrogenase (short-subunit alcohol dehydrogenase family)